MVDVTSGTQHDATASRVKVAKNSPFATREAVFSAAWDLVKSGNRPTIERVRMRLGNGIPHGSPNTVNILLQEWWKQLALHFEGSTSASFPGLPRRVAETLETLWKEAVSAAAEALRAQWANRERQLTDRITELELRVRELTEQNQALEAKSK